MSARRIVLLATTAVAVLVLVFVSAAGGAAVLRSGVAGIRAIGGGSLKFSSRWLAVSALAKAGAPAPTDAACRASLSVPCYSPQEIQHAYGVDRLLNRGDDGAGESIVIIDSFGSPTLASDLASFDAGYGLPAPRSLRILAPLGTVPFDPAAVPDQITWAGETTLDVEWAHAMAPGARIVLLTSPVDETQGVQGMPQFDFLLNYALDHHLGKIISQTWGTAENTLFTPAGADVLKSFQRTYARAAAMGVTVLAATGDSGSSNLEMNGTTFYPFPTVNFPASSPLVTAVGGTSLNADTSGDYQSETVWNGAGGGISQVFGEPVYQRFLPSSVQSELGDRRGIPDVSWNADPNTPILFYLSFAGQSSAGYYIASGTSEGPPEWAGLVSDFDELLKHPIGLLNPYLYALGVVGKGFHDVTVGNNSDNGVAGYDATPGWDLASGWGTPDIGQLFDDIDLLARRDESMRALVFRARSSRR